MLITGVPTSGISELIVSVIVPKRVLESSIGVAGQSPIIKAISTAGSSTRPSVHATNGTRDT